MPTLTMMTWNVRYFSQRLRGARVTEGNLRRAAEAIVASGLHVDVIALQEVEDASLRAGLHPEGQLVRFLLPLHQPRAGSMLARPSQEMPPPNLCAGERRSTTPLLGAWSA